MDSIHSFWRGSHGLSARRAQRTKSRGPKGLQLEVGARRAPRLLFHIYFVLHNQIFMVLFFCMVIFIIMYSWLFSYSTYSFVVSFNIHRSFHICGSFHNHVFKAPFIFMLLLKFKSQIFQMPKHLLASSPVDEITDLIYVV